MKVGKLAESVLTRSVLRQIRFKNENVVNGAGVGADCAIFALSDADRMAACVQEAAVAGKADMGYAVQRAANNLACAGAVPIAAMIALLIPEQAEEGDIQMWMEAAEQACMALGMQIAGGHTSVCAGMEQAHVTVTGIGRLGPDKAGSLCGAAAGQDIVITKWIALEGTSLVARRYREQLSARYPMHMIEEAESFDRQLSVLPEAELAVRQGATALHDVSEGGIFRALWEVAEAAGTGLTVDLKQIPIRQETVEVCEFFNLNPYELTSGGSLIIVTDNGPDMVRELAAEGIPAAVAGKLTDSNDRIVINGEERRFLDRPRTDEIHKIREGRLYNANL